ncbi:hypothetical protein SO694_00183010 [Aureococcus anophagefferens]|uniref:Uncharacterized protein n=1 Tax=Aureococcus anophagefferens TaxID=44056 RepID=A0ABR1FGG0_AURAN
MAAAKSATPAKSQAASLRSGWSAVERRAQHDGERRLEGQRRGERDAEVHGDLQAEVADAEHGAPPTMATTGGGAAAAEGARDGRDRGDAHVARGVVEVAHAVDEALYLNGYLVDRLQLRAVTWGVARLELPVRLALGLLRGLGALISGVVRVASRVLLAGEKLVFGEELFLYKLFRDHPRLRRAWRLGAAAQAAVAGSLRLVDAPRYLSRKASEPVLLVSKPRARAPRRSRFAGAAGAPLRLVLRPGVGGAA